MISAIMLSLFTFIMTIEKWAKEAGAVCKVGKAVIVDCEVLDRYLETFRLPAE